MPLPHDTSVPAAGSETGVQAATAVTDTFPHTQGHALLCLAQGCLLLLSEDKREAEPGFHMQTTLRAICSGQTQSGSCLPPLSIYK